MTTTICPSVWDGKTFITKCTYENWFNLYITENDSNHGPSNDVCIVLTAKQLESLRDTIVAALSSAESAAGVPEAAESVELAEK